MKEDKLLKAFKAFEIKNAENVKGGYWKIIYGAGRNVNESYYTMYSDKNTIDSQGYTSLNWEAVHNPGAVALPGGGTNPIPNKKNNQSISQMFASKRWEG
jgi:hypothetical protein